MMHGCAPAPEPAHPRCVTAQVAVYAPAPVTREPGSESSTCFAGAYSPWPLPFAPPTPLRPPPQTPPRWFVAVVGELVAGRVPQHMAVNQVTSSGAGTPDRS